LFFCCCDFDSNVELVYMNIELFLFMRWVYCSWSWY